MGSRQFTDEAGRVWVAWNVTPVPRHGRPAAAGWVVFETADGREKRRLLASPDGWDEMAETDLHIMLASAAAARPSKLTFEPARTGDPRLAGPSMTAESAVAVSAHATTTTLAAPGAESRRSASMPAERMVRSFRYPNGRLWSVCVVRRPDGGGEALLRFAAGARHLDLHDWPEDWAGYTEERLVDLVRSVPRAPNPDRRGSAAQRRRHDDPRG